MSYKNSFVTGKESDDYLSAGKHGDKFYCKCGISVEENLVISIGGDDPIAIL